MMFPLVLTPPPILRLCIAYLRSPKGGCCSISDDLSCSHILNDCNTSLNTVAAFRGMHVLPAKHSYA